MPQNSNCCASNKNQRQQYLDQLHQHEIEVSFDNHEAEPAEPEKRNQTEGKIVLNTDRNADLMTDNTVKKFISHDEVNKKALE